MASEDRRVVHPVLSWELVPAEEKARLARNEAAQRRRTKERGLPALPVSVHGMWLVQRGRCTCNECRGEVALQPGDIVIAHPYFRAGKGSPGHVPTNVALWRAACNEREARAETSALGRGRRLSVNAARPSCPRQSPKWPKRKNGFKSRYKRKVDGTVVKR